MVAFVYIVNTLASSEVSTKKKKMLMITNTKELN